MSSLDWESFFSRDLRDAVRFFGFPNVVRRAIVNLNCQSRLVKVDFVLHNHRSRKHMATTAPQSSTIVIVYTLSILSFPALFHSNLEETKTSDLENSHPD